MACRGFAAPKDMTRPYSNGSLTIMSLNIWGGQLAQNLSDFLSEQKKFVDVFCLQEIYDSPPRNLKDPPYQQALTFSQIQKILPHHKGYFRSGSKNSKGIALFIQKSLLVEKEGDLLIHEAQNAPKDSPDHPKNLQWVKIKLPSHQNLCIAHFHGLCRFDGQKIDSPRSLNQLRRIQKFLETQSFPYILCGDFNLRPNTQGIKLFEKNLKMNNLVMKNHFKTTRNPLLYKKNEPYADYFFTSPDIAVEKFEVLTVNVSDHYPLVTTIKIPEPSGMAG